MSTMATFVCPKGHASTEADYCSECGARIGDEAAPAAVSSGGGAEHCPECGAAREQPGIVFCEICGYNFATGARGGYAVAPAAPVAAVEAASSVTAAGAGIALAPKVGSWQLVVSVDAALRDPQSPEAPSGVVPVTVALSAPVSLIGRRSQARAIYPEIDLSYDDAVSHRHALLQVDGAGGLTLRDIGASNGTRLNDQMIEPLKDHALTDGDEITLGHWSRLVVKAVEEGSQA